MPWALAALVAAVAIFTAAVLLKVLLYVLGWTLLVLIGGILAALAVVVLAVRGRRPINS
jgi:hypothetical protein